jgi:hypothetical protein
MEEEEYHKADFERVDISDFCPQPQCGFLGYKKDEILHVSKRLLTVGLKQ